MAPTKSKSSRENGGASKKTNGVFKYRSLRNNNILMCKKIDLQSQQLQALSQLLQQQSQEGQALSQLVQQQSQEVQALSQLVRQLQLHPQSQPIQPHSQFPFQPQSQPIQPHSQFPFRPQSQPIQPHSQFPFRPQSQPIQPQSQLPFQPKNQPIQVQVQYRENGNLIQSTIKVQKDLSLQKNLQVPKSERKHELLFACGIPDRIFTGSKINMEDDPTNNNVPIRVVLLDKENKVVADGPSSSLKLSISVVCGDCTVENPEKWREEIKANRVSVNPKKGCVLVGNCVKAMKNGVCSFNDLKFVDNSCRETSGMYKLVAEVVAPTPVEILPAFTKGLQVMELRGKYSKKQTVPSWNDEIWRLKQIQRNKVYHNRLQEHGISTVMDFRQRYTLDESSLRKILKATDFAWKTMVEHANECCPNRDLFFGYDSDEYGVELLFNCFYDLIGVSFDHLNERNIEDLSESDKSLVERLRRDAIKDYKKLVKINSVSGWPSAKTSSWNPRLPPHQAAEVTSNESLFSHQGNATLKEPQLLHASRNQELTEFLFRVDHQDETNFEDSSELNQIFVGGQPQHAFDNFNNLSQFNPDSECPSAPDPLLHQGNTTLNQHPVFNNEMYMQLNATEMDCSSMWSDCTDGNNQL